MKTVTEILDFADRDAVAARVGVSREAIRKAEAKAKLPAMWYAALENMTGRPLPRELFSFKGNDQ